MDVAKVQDRGTSTLIPSSEAKKHGSEVSPVGIEQAGDG